MNLKLEGQEKAWEEKRRVRGLYETSAPTYDLLYSSEQRDKFRVVRRVITRTEVRRVLDAGCGTCLFSSALEGHGELFTVGVDLSPRLLKICLQKLRGAGADLTLICADVDHLPLRGEIFDLSVAFTLIDNLPAPKAALREIARVSGSIAPIAISRLRKGSTPQDFRALLEEAGLVVEEFIDEEHIQDLIAVCHKYPQREGEVKELAVCSKI